MNDQNKGKRMNLYNILRKCSTHSLAIHLDIVILHVECQVLRFDRKYHRYALNSTILRKTSEYYLFVEIRFPHAIFFLLPFRYSLLATVAAE
jgi:hypothetical protein